VDDQDIKDSIIAYADLCEFADLPRSYAHPSGNFLVEIAEWCNERGWPPLNALAVNGETRYPGEGYSEAPGCDDWDRDVRRVIAFIDYPAQID
jgi:hypothetical protein